jgi:uncharacterized protein (UPF0548 family)
MADPLETQPLTYAEVGATRGELPPDYHHVSRSMVVGSGRRDFDIAADAVFDWQAQRGSGVRVEAGPVEEGAVARLFLGPGRLAITAPARVVYVVDEPDRRGFGYGTLPGHPESGEESFVVSIRPDGSVVFSVTAFSRPATLLTRLGGPVARGFQRVMADQYCRAIRRVVARS